MLRIFFIIIISICAISCGKYDVDMSKYLNVDYDLNCIWDKASHCAFTSLVEFNGNFYCCFREANSHIPYRNGGYGIIRILESSDGNEWYSVCVIEDAQYDLRDPYMSITPDNRLMLICGRLVIDQMDNRIIQHGKVCFFDSAQSIRDSIYEAYDISIENNENDLSYWLWKVKWHNGIAYGVAYNDIDTPILVKSIDGIAFSIITELPMQVNECDIDFIGNDMILVCRPKHDYDMGFVGMAAYPYNDWRYAKTKHRIHSPDILILDDIVLVAGRGDIGTTIFQLNDNIISPIKVLPSDGDFGYPGIIYDRYNNNVCVSYYTTISTSKVYFARLNKDMLAL